VISRTSKIARTSWAFAYLFFLVSGVFALFVPLQIVDRALLEFLVYGWAGFLTIGGGLCLGGKLRNNWAGELIGLPLLSAANYILGALLIFESSSSAAIAIGAMFVGVGTAFIGRWVELHRLAKDNQGVNSGRS
jgi:hypothetical protein